MDDAVMLVLEKDRFAVGHQMQVGLSFEDIRQTLAHLALEKTEDPADLLEGESLSTQFSDDCNFDYFFGVVNALVTFVAWGHNLALIPPLKLPQAYLRDPGDVTAAKSSTK